MEMRINVKSSKRCAPIHDLVYGQTFMLRTYETCTLQRDREGKVIVAKQKTEACRVLRCNMFSLLLRPNYAEEESQEEEKRRDIESESDRFGRRCRRADAAWRLESAVISWRIDRAHHADWRHDHGLSQTASTWTARRWSRGRWLIMLLWLASCGEPLDTIGRSEARRMITHTSSTARRASRPEKASLRYQTFDGYVQCTFFRAKFRVRWIVISHCWASPFNVLYTSATFSLKKMDANQTPLSPPASPQFKHVSVRWIKSTATVDWVTAREIRTQVGTTDQHYST